MKTHQRSMEHINTSPEFSEVICIKNGAYHHLAYHQHRVDITTQHFGLPSICLDDYLPSPQQYQTIHKCRMVYGVHTPKVTILPYTYTQIEQVCIVQTLEISYSYKFANRSQLNAIKQLAEDREPLLAVNGLITDSSFCNLVFDTGRALFTPQIPLLNGTKRQYLIDKHVITPRQISVSDIKQYERIRFINAMIDLEDNISVEITNEELPIITL